MYLVSCIGLLFETVGYSLHQLSRIPEEILWISCLRQWVSLMKNTHLNHLLCRNIKYSLRPWKITNPSSRKIEWDTKRLTKYKPARWIFKLYSICDNTSKIRNTMHKQFIEASPPSFHINPIEHTTKIKSNIGSIENPLYTEHEY